MAQVKTLTCYANTENDNSHLVSIAFNEISVYRLKIHYNALSISLNIQDKLKKTLHKLNPAFMKAYLLPKSTSYDLRRNNVLVVPKVNTTKHGIRSISFSGPKK